MINNVGFTQQNTLHVHDGEEGMEDTGESRQKYSTIGQAYMAAQAQLIADKPRDKKGNKCR